MKYYNSAFYSSVLSSPTSITEWILRLTTIVRLFLLIHAEDQHKEDALSPVRTKQQVSRNFPFMISRTVLCDPSVTKLSQAQRTFVVSSERHEARRECEDLRRELDRMTPSQLSSYCKMLGAKSSGSKTELIDVLCSCLGTANKRSSDQ